MLNREDALKLLTDKLKRENMVKHCLAVEAIMKEMAAELGGDQEVWGLVGLLHDIDFDETSKDPKRQIIRKDAAKNNARDSQGSRMSSTEIYFFISRV